MKERKKPLETIRMTGLGEQDKYFPNTPPWEKQNLRFLLNILMIPDVQITVLAKKKNK